MSLRESATALQADLVRQRRAFHREPETGLDLPRTQRKVLAALDDLPLETTAGRSASSVVAVLRGDGDRRYGRRAVLLRADMDALPVDEQTGLPFASTLAGTMHACGHDLHTSMLLGAARLLAAHRTAVGGDVVFMFQPGEESGQGARQMIQEGILDVAGTRPMAAFALHVVATMPAGLFSTRAGPILASADTLAVTVRGRGGHASSPHRAADPIPAACEMVTALQIFVTRRFAVSDPIVITVSNFHAGGAGNAIPEEARFEASIRSLSREARTQAKEGTLRVINGIAAAHGLEVEADFVESYPLTANDAAQAEFAAATISQVFGEHRFSWSPYPVMATDDFSHVLTEVPGVMVFLGACPPGRDPRTAAFNHAPDAIFDDAVLSDGAALLAGLALRRLAAA